MRPVGMIDLDVLCFTTLDTCAAAGIRSAKLMNWLNFEPPVILLRDSERPPKGVNHVHLLTLRRIYQIALTAELIRLGVMAQRAGNLAAMFTDQEGENPTGRHGDLDHVPRRAGHLFPSGSTTLVANKDGRFGPVIAAVVNAPLVEVARRYTSGALVVDVEEVVNRVLTSLGLTEQCAVPEIEPAILHIPPHVPAMMSEQLLS